MFKRQLYIQSTSTWTGHVSRAQEPHVASGFMLDSTQTKRLTCSLQWVKAYLAWLFMPLVFKSKELCLAIISWAWDLWVSGILIFLSTVWETFLTQVSAELVSCEANKREDFFPWRLHSDYCQWSWSSVTFSAPFQGKSLGLLHGHLANASEGTPCSGDPDLPYSCWCCLPHQMDTEKSWFT